MQFYYEGKKYDIRFKPRFLPKPLKNIGTFDLMVLMNSRTSKKAKLDLLQSYDKGITL